MHLRHSRSVCAITALVLTAAAAAVALAPSAPAAPAAADRAGHVLMATAAHVSAQSDAAAKADNVLVHVELHEEEQTVLAERAAAQELAVEQSDEASAILESIKVERVGAAEQATRDYARAKLAAAPPREMGQIMAAERGFTGSQWTCLDRLWQRESNWNPSAQNRSSGAYGIPQSLPGSKMATVADDWRTNPATQITWGLNYIVDRYGTPCGAWAHSENYNWY